MGKMTFIVDFPDGQEPAVGAGTDILGGQFISVYFGDMREQSAWRPADQVPPYNELLMVQHADGSRDVDICSEYSGWYGEDDETTVKYWMPLPDAMEADDE
ncbi:hypothetical protein [Rahnella sp. ChDrAdgB13]|uniref:hypothetical protein n=1 Tax=Rahnella sp. ChDrAdgB13 TaxID=1850581 RepID=UPI001AD889E3|nr:hypothetical protein [Rahnella sp. ChDrAdgB13]